LFLHHQGHPDVGGSKLLSNVGQYLKECTTQHTRRQPSSTVYVNGCIQFSFVANYVKVHYHAEGCFFVKAVVTPALGVMVTAGMFF
jgi:hypothetical protein